jgi:hypothetical protein
MVRTGVVSMVRGAAGGNAQPIAVNGNGKMVRMFG